jgi:xanthine dehydrogenase YagR molybdenum-binding subunit
MGGMIWGVSSALHEATEIDKERARYVNDNLADYRIPVNADIQQLEVISFRKLTLTSIPLASRA